ncbi:MAG: glyoxylate/hydroxypyruvate reductase A [SAR324 cluster bacterium]|nr:glyoxylate/hydroxypyruvate reductase A [SAR324 cluster bacterium]MBL7035901.1 glyoxylate/hydroxypyruvate reductase A [SAR324 cluster bacterium]
MSLLISIPDSMRPNSLGSALLSLDPKLEIAIGQKNVQTPAEVEFAVVWKHPQGLLKNFPNLKAISSYGHGADGLLSDRELPADVPLVRLTDSTMAKWMSEYLLTVVLLQRRQLLEYANDPGFSEWGTAVRLPGNNIGILGLGYLGQAAAEVFLRMDFEVLGWSRTQKKVDDVVSFHGKNGLNEMLKETDYLINLLPHTPDTQDLINTKVLSQLKCGAFFINVGRGQTLVEDDLIPLLDNGRLAGACLDVFRTEPLPAEHPFRRHKKILITPHNSSATPAESVAPQILENYRRAVSGRQLLNLVDREHGY